MSPARLGYKEDHLQPIGFFRGAVVLVIVGAALWYLIGMAFALVGP